MDEGSATSPAIVPLIEGQFGRLIGASAHAVRRDVDVASRALAAAVGLYDLDGLTIGAGADWVAEALEATSRGGEAADPTASLVDAAAVRHVSTLVARLRATFPHEIGLVVVIPSPRRLARHRAETSERHESRAVLQAIVSHLGEAEPDAILVRPVDGDDPDVVAEVEPLGALAKHFGVPLWILRASDPRVALHDERELTSGDPVRPRGGVRLVGTSDELSELSPPLMRNALARLRAAYVSGG